jgi:hypothetical protein
MWISCGCRPITQTSGRDRWDRLCDSRGFGATSGLLDSDAANRVARLMMLANLLARRKGRRLPGDGASKLES